MTDGESSRSPVSKVEPPAIGDGSLAIPRSGWCAYQDIELRCRVVSPTACELTVGFSVFILILEILLAYYSQRFLIGPYP